jgi:hypothetical protein
VGNGFGPGSIGLTAAVGVANSALGVVSVEEIEYGTLGMSPTSGTGIRLKKLGSNVAVFNFCDTAGAKTLIDATANASMPAASDVRSGVSYASGVLSGSCAVPAASSVAFGVPVDATTGTALLTGAAVASAVWGAATRSITGGTVDTLTNAPDVPTEAEIATAVWAASTKEITGGTVTNLTNAPASVTPNDIWSHSARTLTSASGPTATEIRQEMDSNSTKLANLDASVSSRLAGSAYTAPSTPPTVVQIRQEIDANSTKLDAAVSSRLAASESSKLDSVKAKTDALPIERLQNCATTAIVGNLIAQANS